jgi:hypothetical protein
MKTHRGFMAHRKQHSGSLLTRAPNIARRLIAGRALISAGALIAASAFVAAASSCATVEPVIVAEPGVAFSLPVGKTVTINGNGTRITFRQVREDSRCPTDVTCVWAGDARIDVTISRNGSSDETGVLSLAAPNNVISSGDLQIRFVGLAPAPRHADGDAPRAYVAQLIVNRT